MKSRLPLLIALTLSCTALGSAGCSGGPGVTIELYNGQHLQTTQALVDAFERQSGIKVAIESDDEHVLADQIVTEGPNSPADVIFTENSPTLEFLQSKGLLAAVDRSTLANVPGRFDSPNGDWVGVSARVSVIVYNTSLISPGNLPTSIMQLSQPAWRGKIAIAPAETDFQPIVTSVVHSFGQGAALRWLDGLKANAAGHIYPDNETVTSEVNSGAVELGVVDQYYWYRLQAEVGKSATHSAIAYFAAGDPGYVIDVSGAAVLRSSKHKADAERFLAFLTSRQGQQIIAGGSSYEYPLAAGVAVAKPETPFDQLHPDPIDVAELGDGSVAVALLRQVQLL